MIHLVNVSMKHKSLVTRRSPLSLILSLRFINFNLLSPVIYNLSKSLCELNSLVALSCQIAY